MLQRLHLLHSIRDKIIGALVVLLLSMLMFVHYFLAPLSQDYAQRIHEQAGATADLLARSVSAAVEFDDVTSIKKTIEGVEDLMDVAYAAVGSEAGMLMGEAGKRPAELTGSAFSGPDEEIGVHFLIARRTIKTVDDRPVGRITIAMSLDRLSAQTRRYSQILFIGGAAVVTVAILIAALLSRLVARPLAKVMRSVESVAQGNLDTPDVIVQSRDEIGRLAASINQMTRSLRKISRESERERWLKTGQAELSDQMRGDYDVPTLCRNIITYLAKYLVCQAGTLYLATAGSLKLTGSYAYQWRSQPKTTIQFGEGLVGQVALEKLGTVISAAYEDQVIITSSLIEAAPRSVLIAPILLRDALVGVVELGSLTTLGPEHLEFLKLIGENIAMAIKLANDRTRVQELLEETQRQSEELQDQQSHLKQTNHELHAKAEALKRSEEQLRAQSEEMQATNAELEEKTEFLQRQKVEITDKNVTLERTRQEIEQKARELEQASTYKSEFLANMSHELRTPLNSLLILSKHLAGNKTGNLSADQVEAAQVIYAGGQDLLGLINDILDLSKVEAGMLELHVEEVPYDTIIRSLDRQFRAVAIEKGLDFRIDRAEGLPTHLETDAQRVEQILKNLLGNAFKFTQHGSVTLRLQRATAVIASEHGILGPDNAVAFSVIDTGIGIPKNKQQAIFEAFQQADGSTSRKYGGTGLGLTISRQIAGLVRGAIAVESELGKGSTFTLYLPLVHTRGHEEEAPRLAAALVSPSRSQGPQGLPEVDRSSQRRPESPIHTFLPDDREAMNPGDKSVLIVEDDASFAKILMNLARARGYKCMVAGDGTRALLMAQKFKPTVILLDLGLPDVPGLAVLEQLKDGLETRHIPVHVISSRQDDKPSLAGGALGFLAKPATTDALQEMLAKTERFIQQSVKRILMADESDSHRREVAHLLGSMGVDITATSSGADAHERLNSERYDCVIVGGTLSDMTVFELLDRIARDRSTGTPPIVVYSGHEMEETERRRLREYASRIVVKNAGSSDRLLDEVTLFLHSVESTLPDTQRKIIRLLHAGDRVLHHRKVLLVDDDMRNAFALAKVLGEHGLSVVIADNGAVALDKLTTQPDIELVLMDIMMPVMDGYQAMGRIRAQPRFKSLPILAATAKAMPEERAKCLAAGANDYITKPIDLDKLLTLMRVWLFRAAV